MSNTKVMNDSEVQEHLTKLPGWKYQDKAIQKQFEFSNFLESVAFVNKVAPLAEELGHHPDLQIQYSKVTVTLTTHDSGGVTQKDLELAKKIETMERKELGE